MLVFIQMVTTHEKQTFAPVSPELEQAHQFEKARRELYNIIYDVEMQFEEKGVDPTSVKQGNYWLAVADHANRVVNEKYSTAETFEYGKLVQLTALIPAGFMAERNLAKLQHTAHGRFTSTDHEQRHNLVGVASRYKDSIASYARSDDNLTAPALNTHICQTLEITLEHKADEIRNLVSSDVRGIQHEVATGYLLMSALEARVSSPVEDVQGADYIVSLEDGKGFMVDIKTSVGAVVSEGGDAKDGWAVNKGRIVLASPLDDSDLEGKFYPNERAMKTKTPLVGSAIRAAFKKASNLRTVQY